MTLREPNRAARWTVVGGVTASAVLRCATYVYARTNGGGPNPGAAELVAFLPLTMVIGFGLLQLVRADQGPRHRLSVGAASLVTAALAVLAWITILQPYAGLASLSVAQRSVVVGYPVAGLGLMFGALLVFAESRERRPGVILACVAVACHTAANTAHVIAAAHPATLDTSPLLGASLGFYALLVVVALWSRTRSSAGDIADIADVPGDVLGEVLGEVELDLTDRPSVKVIGLLISVGLIDGLGVIAALPESRVTALTVAVLALILTGAAAGAVWRVVAQAGDELARLAAEGAARKAELLSTSGKLDEATVTLDETAEFLAEMTRRVARPLNAVLTASEDLRATSLDGAQNLVAHQLAAGGDALLGIINDLLGISRDAHGETSLLDGDFSLHEVARDVAGLHARVATDKGLDIVVAVDDTVPPLLRGDADRLAELLEVFVDNAIASTTKGGVMIAASLVEERDSREAVIRIGVHDSGHGLSPEQGRSVLESEDNDANERRFRPNPRGLVRARTLVELFGGCCGVESQVGRGASFWFTIVVRVAAPAVETVPEAVPAPELEVEPELVELEAEPVPEPELVELMAEPVPEPELVAVVAEPEPAPVLVEAVPLARHGLVLLAEDDPLCRRVTLVALKRCGFQVDVVTDGLDAVSAVATRHYDVVLMDCQMPRMSGLEAATTIRAKEQRPDHVPIIALTAYAEDKDRAAAHQAGMDDVLAKPFGAEELVEMLGRWLPQESVGISAAS